MIRVLERRVIESTMKKFSVKPLGGTFTPRHDDIAKFLSGNFDDQRCASLLSGLVWVRPYGKRDTIETSKDAEFAPKDYIPFAYSAVKPIFVEEDTLQKAMEAVAGKVKQQGLQADWAVPREVKLPIPSKILPGLLAGSGFTRWLCN